MSVTTDLDAFMATMVAQSGPVPLEQATELARACYGLEAQATRLTGERDENFRLTTREGADYVLKIAHPSESAAVTELQLAALLHLERVDPAIACPRVVRALNGALEVRFQDAAGRSRSARLLTYLPGRLLLESVRSTQQRRACGRIGGRMARALATFEHPASGRAVIWDVRHAGHLRRLLEQMPCFAYRAPVSEVLARLVPELAARLPAMRRQIVHNDLNPRNVLVDPAQHSRVIGVIDFGDLTRTALIADVGVAGAEMIPPQCTDPLEARECVLDVARAYHETVPLLPAELRILPGLVSARLLMNVVVHEWHVHHNPSNGHFAALDPDYMRTQIRLAARLPSEEITL
jgi:hydroxylysine kinase